MPRILTLDIETSPMLVYTWGLFEQNIGLNQIKTDWHILAWAAKWVGSDKVYYMDNRNAKDVTDDKKILEELIKLMNDADIIVTQNGDKFDFKKIRARAVLNGLPPIRPIRSTDIYKEGKKVFGFTSHKLAYITENINRKYKKLDHKNYPGFELWKAVLAGDKRAWKEMETYTKHDVLSTEETYLAIQGWIKTPNTGVYLKDLDPLCNCSNTRLVKKGFAYTDSGKYQVYHCLNCGKWPRSKVNLLSKDKKRGLLK